MTTASERQQMIADIEAGVSMTRDRIGRDQLDPRVMDAMRRVPRELFVPGDSRAAAFHDGALAIGHGQTISQPYIVALMTDLIEPSSEHRVLEIGTGSGYQAAVLSCLVRRVYSVERIRPLAQGARARLQQLGYDNVEVRCSDGYRGWSDQAPFDGIVVTAAAPAVPAALIEQLTAGGRMVVPVGPPRQEQRLTLVSKDSSGAIEQRELLSVAFVPMLEGLD